MKCIYCVDLETTVNGGPDPKNLSPEAHWLNNRVLMCGWSRDGTGVGVGATANALCSDMAASIAAGHEVWFVAHNAKFDLKYLMRDYPRVAWEKIHVWDTMTWEYRNSGHFSKFASLEATAKAHGIKFKKTLDLGALLSTGVKMEDIPKDTLSTYLHDDVRVLGEIFNAQSALCEEWDMDYILPLAEMELNGLTIARKDAQHLMMQLTHDTTLIENEFIEHMRMTCEWQDGSPLIEDDFTDQLGPKSKYIKPMAARSLSFILTGEPIELKVTEKWRVRYQSGYGPRYTKLPAVFKNPTNLGYPVGEGVLEGLTDWASKATLNYRGDSKVLGTYVSPFLHTAAIQGAVYPKLNTTVTGTGRLSSSAPNGQNIPEIVRELIVPKFATDDMIEVDFKQLEIVAVACVSGCKALINDLINGVDVHYKSGKKVFGWKTEADMDEEHRKIVKGVNFGLLYGGKAAGLSKQTGVDKKIVQSLIDSFYSKYPGVATWQKSVFTDVTGNMFAHHIDDTAGEQVYASEYNEPFSGRKFLFIEQKSPVWLRHKTGRAFSFSPQHTSNYPIQGFAGGDLVMFALTHVWRSLRGKVRFVMTVHDSIVLEGDDSHEVEDAMDEACKATQVRFNLPVALDYDIKIGSTWS